MCIVMCIVYSVVVGISRCIVDGTCCWQVLLFMSYCVYVDLIILLLIRIVIEYFYFCYYGLVWVRVIYVMVL